MCHDILKTRKLFLSVFFGIVIFSAAVAWDVHTVPAAEGPKSQYTRNKVFGDDEPPPRYAHVDTSVSYKVDPNWPKRPANIVWDSVPGVAVDGQDRVWIFTRSTPPVQVYDSDGKFVRAWGEGVIRAPHHMKFDPKGMLWLADVGDNVVVQCTPEGKVLKVLGTRGEAGEDETHFNKPTDMVVTSDGDVFVTDGYLNSRVVHFDRNGKFVKAWGTRGTGPGQFSLPHAITLDSQGRLYVADRNNVRIQVFDQDGRFIDQWTNLLVPWGLWITQNDKIWVCGSSPMPWREKDGALGCPPKDQLFMKFAPSGKLLQLWTIPKGEDGLEKPGQLNWVHAIALDSQGNIYAGDIKGKRVQKFVKQR